MGYNFVADNVGLSILLSVWRWLYAETVTHNFSAADEAAMLRSRARYNWYGSRLSVLPSICLSMTLRYGIGDHIG